MKPSTVKSLFVPATLVAALAAAGCAASGPSEGVVTLAFPGASASVRASSFRAAQASAVPAPSATFAVAGGRVTLSSVRVALKEVEFELDSDAASTAGDVEEFEFKGPFVVDALAGTVAPALPQATLPAGVYEEIEISADKLEDAEATAIGLAADDALRGKSILVAGAFEPSVGTPVPFSIVCAADEDFDLKPLGEAVKPISVDEAGTNAVLISFRMAEWFDGVDFGTALREADGSILVAAGNNIAIYDDFMRNLEKSMDYGEDADGDGALSDLEDDDL